MKSATFDSDESIEQVNMLAQQAIDNSKTLDKSIDRLSHLSGKKKEKEKRKFDPRRFDKYIKKKEAALKEYEKPKKKVATR